MGAMPEGMNLDDVRRHGMNLKVTAMLINQASEFMASPDNSPVEAMAELELNNMMNSLTAKGPQLCGDVILALVSLVGDTADPASVQAWFDHQAEMVGKALADE